jgi:hypothetical protein
MRFSSWTPPPASCTWSARTDRLVIETKDFPSYLESNRCAQHRQMRKCRVVLMLKVLFM